jgi:hypothetical protein
VGWHWNKMEAGDHWWSRSREGPAGIIKTWCGGIDLGSVVGIKTSWTLVLCHRIQGQFPLSLTFDKISPLKLLVHGLKYTNFFIFFFSFCDFITREGWIKCVSASSDSTNLMENIRKKLVLYWRQDFLGHFPLNDVVKQLFTCIRYGK